MRPTMLVPEHTTDSDEGRRAFRLNGTLEFSLTGILARLSAVLAENKIGILGPNKAHHTFVDLSKSAGGESAMAFVAAA